MDISLDVVSIEVARSNSNRPVAIGLTTRLGL